MSGERGGNVIGSPGGVQFHIPDYKKSSSSPNTLEELSLRDLGARPQPPVSLPRRKSSADMLPRLPSLDAGLSSADRKSTQSTKRKERKTVAETVRGTFHDLKTSGSDAKKEISAQLREKSKRQVLKEVMTGRSTIGQEGSGVSSFLETAAPIAMGLSFVMAIAGPLASMACIPNGNSQGPAASGMVPPNMGMF